MSACLDPDHLAAGVPDVESFAELARLKALWSLEVLDTAAEPLFDELAALAAQLCGTPMALISLVDSDRQWFKSRHGLEVCQTSREASFCAHALYSPELFVVPDTRDDPRFAANELVTGAPHLRFYAGAPLVTAAGHALGTLCVLDTQPRALSAAQRGQLAVLARQVVSQLELRRQGAALAAEIAARAVAEAELRASQRLLDGVLANTDVVIYAKDLDGRFLLANPALHQLLRADDGDVLGRSDYDLFPTVAADQFRAHDARIVATGVREMFAEELPHPDGTVHGYLSTKFPLHDDAGVVYAVAGVSTDVTELSQERTAHAESEQRWRSLVEHSPVAVAVIGTDGLFAYANPQALVLYGVDAATALIGRPAMAFVPDGDEAATRALFAEVVGTRRPLHGRRWSLRRDDGQVLITELNAAAITYHGQPAVQVELRDVSSQAAAEAALTRSEQRFRALFECSPVGAAECLTDGTIVAVNPRVCAMLGYTAEELIGRTSRSLLAGEEEIRRHNEDLATLAAGTSSYFSHRVYRRKDGSTVPVLVGVGVSRDQDGRAVRVLATLVDISERVAAEDALHASEARFRTTFDNAPTGLAVVHRDGHALQVNPALCRLTGRTQAELLALPNLLSLAAEADQADLQARSRQCLATPDSTVIAEQRLQRGDGPPWWAQLTLTELGGTDGHGEPSLLLQLEDITERRAAEAALTRQALYDNLTDLPNRAMLLDRATLGLARLTRRPHDGLLAVLFCDLDGFKAVNDHYGHAAGDHLLIEISRRLTAAMRPTDTVARLGGDEFVVLCENVPDQQQATRIAARIATAVAEPVTWHGEQLRVTASIGIAYGTPGGSAAALVADADTAMYQAKRTAK